MKILVAVHDAGGSEILASLCKKYSKRYKWQILAAGPAVKIFRHKKIPVTRIGRWDLREARYLIQKASADFFMTGTGWGTDLERNFIQAAREEGIKACAYLDGWFNFRERFGSSSDWRKNLPDYVFVGDQEAYQLALANGFPKNVIRRMENPYWEFMEKIKSASSKARPRLLYVMQPGQKTYQNWMKRLESRADNIFVYPNLFFQSLTKSKRNLAVRLRPHPSEVTNRITHYIRQLKAKGYAVEKSSRKSTIFEDLKWSDAVVGLESMALVLGLAMGKKAISYLPEKRLQCRLPQKGIKKVRNAKSLHRAIFCSSKDPKSHSFLKVQRLFNKRYNFPKQVKGFCHE